MEPNTKRSLVIVEVKIKATFEASIGFEPIKPIRSNLNRSQTSLFIFKSIVKNVFANIIN